MAACSKNVMNICVSRRDDGNRLIELKFEKEKVGEGAIRKMRTQGECPQNQNMLGKKMLKKERLVIISEENDTKTENIFSVL